MASFLKGLFTVAKKALPIAWNLGKPLIDAGVQAISRMDGETMDMANSRYLLAGASGINFTLDDPISEDDRKKEEVLIVTAAELTQRQALAALQEQMKIEDYAFQMPTTGLVKSQVILSLHLEYTYSNEATDYDIKNVNYKDHVYFHMMPKVFAFYDTLLKHDLVKFRCMNIKSASTGGLDTSTMVGFLPVTTDTTQCSNGLLMQLCKKLEVKPDEEVSYNIRYVSPDIVTYNIDSKKDYKNIKSQYMALEPNKILKTDYIKEIESEENTGLSYGTVVIVKQNLGTVVGMSYNINMEFDCWDYVVNGIKLSDIKDKNLNGIPDDEEGSGSSRFPASSGNGSGRRKAGKQN